MRTELLSAKSIVIIDDHPLIREALRDKLREWGWSVLADAEDGRRGLERAEQLCPAVVLVDISLPDMSGLEVTRRVKEVCPDTRVVVLSVHREAKYLAEAFEAGASGYVAKRSALEKLSECLDAIAAGRLYVDSSLSGAVVEGLRGSHSESVATDTVAPLTAREREVVQLLVQGLSSREVGERLFISHKTVDNHRANVLKKLGLGGAVELVRYAASRGWINLDSWERPSEEHPPTASRNPARRP